MARETVVRITSDLTGVVYSGEDIPAVPITVSGKKANLDLTPEDKTALEALVSGDHGEALRKLILQTSGASIAKPARGSGSGSGRQPAHTAEQNAEAREWAESVGLPLSKQGKIPNWAYERDAEAGRKARQSAAQPAS